MHGNILFYSPGFNFYRYPFFASYHPALVSIYRYLHLLITVNTKEEKEKKEKRPKYSQTCPKHIMKVCK